jgi:hypothetical protein
MTKLKAMLLAAAAAVGLSASAAAMPLNDVTAPNLTQNVRVVCNEFGRCVETGEHWYRGDRDRDRDELRMRGPRARFYGDHDYYDRGPGIEFRLGR